MQIESGIYLVGSRPDEREQDDLLKRSPVLVSHIPICLNITGYPSQSRFILRKMFRSTGTLSLVCITLLVTTSTILAHSPLHDHLKRSLDPRYNLTSDPCNTPLTCGVIQSAFFACANSTDITCGCDAWINFAGDCAACSVLHAGETLFTLPTQVGMFRAFCECPAVCDGVVSTILAAGFGEGTAGEVCGTVFVDCADCVRRTDVYLAQVVTGYFSQLCEGT